MVLTLDKVSGGYLSEPVIHDISFSAKTGNCTALIGLNGAGKSTTIKEIMGLLTPFSGGITLDELSQEKEPVLFRSRVAYIPEAPILYPELTLKEHIELTAKAYHQDIPAVWERALKYVKAFRLEKELEWFPVHFSKGMQQKVMIICAMMLDVSLFVIDEPFLGLDPLAIDTFLTIVEEKKREQKSVLMSTHVLSSAEKLCDAFVMLHEGRVAAYGTLDEVRAQLNEPEATLDQLYLKVARR
ncbi:MAG: ABC transporter ATP-binding protein [Bavariicoccus seileri]|uniref:ABC transporter ATP-binding protein n=1 Tax=Bavariicoccus seileri TaxID=549685 RepID=UPI003F999517